MVMLNSLPWVSKSQKSSGEWMSSLQAEEFSGITRKTLIKKVEDGVLKAGQWKHPTTHQPRWMFYKPDLETLKNDLGSVSEDLEEELDRLEREYRILELKIGIHELTQKAEALGLLSGNLPKKSKAVAHAPEDGDEDEEIQEVEPETKTKPKTEPTDPLEKYQYYIEEKLAKIAEANRFQESALKFLEDTCLPGTKQLKMEFQDDPEMRDKVTSAQEVAKEARRTIDQEEKNLAIHRKSLAAEKAKRGIF